MAKNKFNKIIYGEDARKKILKGMEDMYKVVSTTLGPMGNNISIDKGHETITIHDGYNVFKQAVKNVKDPYEKVGADILFQATQKTVDIVGDGTSLTTILGYNIAHEANKIVAAGVNAMSLREGIESLRDEIIDKINKVSIPVKTVEQMIQVATVSANDKELGKMIGETIQKIGEDGVSTVEESHTRETTVEMQEGLQIDQGYRSPHFATDPDNMTAVLEGPRVLVTDYVLDDFMGQLAPMLEATMGDKSKTLFIIAQDYGGTVLPSLALNKVNGKINVLPVQAPLFEDIQKNLLHDIAIATGATMIGEDSGIKMKDVKFEHLGYAERIKSTKDATLIIGGKGDKKQIATRIKAIKNQIEDAESSFDVAKLQERLAKLQGKVAVIKVGGATEIEMRERKERVEDAVEATKTAVATGIVPGGEITLLNIADSIKGDNNASTIMKNALKAPFRKLLSNAGLDAGEYIQRLKDEPGETGVDVRDGELVNMIQEGIIDPAGVLTSAVFNAVSVSISSLTSEAIIPYNDGNGQGK